MKVRAPARDALIQAVIAECSLSTVSSSAFSSPLATASAKYSTALVIGVIGYAAITSTRDNIAPIAAALAPVIVSFLMDFSS